MEEAEGTEPVCDCNEDYSRILFDEVGTVKEFNTRSACHKSTAVNPHHNGFLLLNRFIRSVCSYRTEP